MLRWLTAFVLVAFTTPAFAQDVRAIKEKGKVDFFIGDKLITTYHTEGYAKPIFYPMNGPGGVPLTRAWPLEKGHPNETTDHIHQKSAWFCHGDVIPQGLELKQKIKGVDGVDFWSENVGHGQMVCTSVSEPRVEKNKAQIVTKNEWRTSDGVVVLNETRVITFYNLNGVTLIVVSSDLTPGSYTVVFGDTKEGSFGIRINDSIIEGKNGAGKGKLQNAEGKVGEKEVWGQISNWCDYSGPINGKSVGLAILADPKNDQATCWHSRGYGLMAANPFGRSKAGFPAMKGKTDLVTLQPGAHLRFRYGMLLHEGDAVAGRVADHYQTFVGLREKE